MTVAAHLKLGFKVTREYKKQLVSKIVLKCYAFVFTCSISNSYCRMVNHQIRSILELLGLESRFNTKCGSLSGGQKKRMSIALELISNPSVIFLDEPTT